ncbi:uncharacterized protein [Nicotiana tomentosiformis]|uniref:uncharacterized protein n=1 Tax=Nicotiana tomentosiformis TaxID=4098 RepID=UPI00388C39F5
MHDFIMAEDSELWNVICDGPFVPMKIVDEGTATVPKMRKQYNDANRKAIEKHFRAKKILESKVNAITEAKDLQKLTIDELIGNLKTYEMKKKKDNERREPQIGKNLVLKKEKNDSSGENADMAYLTKRFQKMVRRNRGIPKRDSSSKPGGYDLCHKCGKSGHFIKDCPLLKQNQYKHNTDKAVKRNQGDSSGESGDDDDQGDNSMMAVESEAAEYDSIFALMAKLNEDEDEVNFLDVQRNLKSYSQKKLITLANVLIETYHSIINDKNTLTTELGEIEHERDDLVVVAVNLRDTIESLKRGKDILTKRIVNIQHERDDLLVVVVDLKETIEKLRRESRPMNTQRERKLKEDLGRVKSEQAGNRVPKKKKPLTNHTTSMLLLLITGSALTVGAVKGSIQRWYMDNGCSKYMTGSTNDFLSLKALQRGSVSFGNGKKGYNLGVGRIGKSLTHSIEKVYYVNGLKYSLLSVSQICEKGNKVEFVSKICTVTNFVTGDVILMAKRYKNIYVVDFESLHNGDLTCLSVVDDDAELWHRRLGHASFTYLNKLVRKDLVSGLPKSSFKDHKVCDACAKRK